MNALLPLLYEIGSFGRTLAVSFVASQNHQPQPRSLLQPVGGGGGWGEVLMSILSLSNNERHTYHPVSTDADVHSGLKVSHQ